MYLGNITYFKSRLYNGFSKKIKFYNRSINIGFWEKENRKYSFFIVKILSEIIDKDRLFYLKLMSLDLLIFFLHNISNLYIISNYHIIVANDLISEGSLLEKWMYNLRLFDKKLYVDGFRIFTTTDDSWFYITSNNVFIKVEYIIFKKMLLTYSCSSSNRISIYITRFNEKLFLHYLLDYR